MPISEIITKYFALLEQKNLSSLLKLFHKSATIYSPLYGKQNPQNFYKSLFDDTNKSKITILGIYSNDDGFIAHFRYNWTLKNKNFITFEGTDVFRIKASLIEELKIIYDTYNIRDDFNSI